MKANMTCSYTHETKIGHQRDTAATHQQRIKFDVVTLHCVFFGPKTAGIDTWV